MLSHRQISQFRTFGFVVLSNLLASAEVTELTGEVRGAIADAFGGLGTDLDPEGPAASAATTCPSLLTALR